MAPERKQPHRQVQVNLSSHILPPEVVAKRTKRHLDELERSNYAEPSASLAGLTFDDNDEGGGKSAQGRARATISDKRVVDGKKKKSSMNIRTALLYRKNLTTLIEESSIANFPPHVPTYLTVTAPPAREPPRLLCTICGYWGRYKCRKCALAYCDRNCEGVHNETRCERRFL